MRESAYKNVRRLLVVLSAFAVIHTAGTAMAGDTAEASFVKDLDVRQRPMAAIVPASETKPTAKAKLSVSVAVDRPNRTYNKGDSVVLVVKATEDAYIWIFDTGTSGKVHQIYPNRFEKNNFLTGGKDVNNSVGKREIRRYRKSSQRYRIGHGHRFQGRDSAYCGVAGSECQRRTVSRPSRHGVFGVQGSFGDFAEEGDTLGCGSSGLQDQVDTRNRRRHRPAG